MPKTTITQASSNRAAALKEAESLARQLLRVYSAMRTRGDPSLVDVRRLLKQALCLRRSLKDAKGRLDFRTVVKGLWFLLRLIDNIYPLNFCHQPRELCS